jgi:hypothetical protein
MVPMQQEYSKQTEQSIKIENYKKVPNIPKKIIKYGKKLIHRTKKRECAHFYTARYFNTSAIIVKNIFRNYDCYNKNMRDM